MGPRRAAHRPLLLLDPEGGRLPELGLEIAAALLPRGGLLHVLVPVRLPLAVALEAPPGEETAAAAALLARLERLAGERGVRVRGHLCRGRTLRALLQETLRQVGADVVVLQGPAEPLLAAVADLGVQPILLPDGTGR